ncbi:MAG TPA: hypothetical protein VNN55_12585 [bacterium]|nr:hypothetical protein [bacterium]
MNTVRHHYELPKRGNERARGWTYWTLVMVIVAVFMALTFGDAGGSLPL